MSSDAPAPSSFGPNAWLVDEMYEQFLDDPQSVGESWREFFADYKRDRPTGPVPAVGTPTPTPPPAPAAPSRPAPQPSASPTAAAATPAADAAGAEPLRGAAARIVLNMEASLGVPTATSFRDVPAKLLEVNRRIINGYLARTRGGKVSFTHLIGFAVVKAFETVPAMKSSYALVDGKPGAVRHEHVGLGIAVDVEKSDGSRTLLVPAIKQADTMSFAEFHAAYEELIRKVRTNKIGADDLAGVTASLTNPGTVGTLQSVPRLMPGQGVIVGVGALDFPAEYQAADPRALAELGVSKVMTITSTYDHRIIQGAESGLFLKRIHELLLGADEFYVEVFRSLGVPYEPAIWKRDENPNDSLEESLRKHLAVNTLINMHRVRGHLIADLDPLKIKEPDTHSELDPLTYGLTIWDLDREFVVNGLAGHERLALVDILGILRDAYCRTIGVEYMHIQDPEQKRWIQERVEGVKVAVEALEQRHVLEKLNAAEAFEKFLATKYVGAKRFGLEGAESTIPLLDAVLEAAADAELDGAVLGMAHRGRLNVLANIIGKSLTQVFGEFEGHVDPDMVQGSGDVKYHLGARGTFRSRTGNLLEVQLAANPSHLEAVDPVVEGMVRAMQDRINRPGSYTVLPLLIHGDAAFAGQGVVSETLNLSDLKGYRTGGTIHLVINNQLGFTTAPEFGRSSVYATDVAKMVQAPILHVNGDDPEACVRVAKLAFAFRQRFNIDVVIDMWCYRRHGHNEGDDPSYTQPLMYRRIDEARSVRKLYVEALVRRGDITIDEAEQALTDFSAKLQAALDETRALATDTTPRAPRPGRPVGVLPPVETGVERTVLDHLFGVLDTTPEGFTVHPKLARQFDQRRKLWQGGEVDWALGEALAFGSLVAEQTDIRFAGQDSRRGTFSHRHAVLVDYETGDEHAPLAHVSPDQGKFWIYDSSLSEYAAMGFEYGYSLVHRDALVCWEAQFGDFMNGAQIIIDQFLAAAEDKWGQTSGLVLLLPHGYDGQGPEHSSGRIERFLTLCAEDNMQVANATTAAQYFHLLRRQVRRSIRKPLVVFTPKYLLRAKESRSPITDLEQGAFREVLDDPGVSDPSSVRRVVLCSGKVAFDLMKRRDERGVPAAVVRVEQLYPWPEQQIRALVDRYEHADSVFWVQEEPDNMGAWPFAGARLLMLLPDRVKLGHASRVESGSPATGSANVHAQELEDLLEEAYAGV
ncbi:MAG TPA: multifunctional oxoglutarate decarboxylase/oxoglutarate dehydrogenase thiamine pyrophosphate-binding subunit/dihydrolipoyllysine-residue succinyltransferase subunit [Acidimicrobiales bacterium]|nr:multifunctional oxoglutarate decarboxylase/oxoglutarate dehydrogenase thiamine pyrophosphate-binding subunit/dihydrolipoyllysine-residue succinyltransferase subunit [Acidimicrobiales bacterium]